EDLDRSLDLRLAADQRIDLALGGLAVEVDTIGVQRLAAGLRVLLRGLALRALHAAGLGTAMGLGDAMADVVDGVEARHLLLLQEEDRVTLALGEDRHQDIGAGHLLAAGGLHMDRRALEHALEAGGGLCLAAPVGDEIAELAIDV